MNLLIITHLDDNECRAWGLGMPKGQVETLHGLVAPEATTIIVPCVWEKVEISIHVRQYPVGNPRAWMLRLAYRVSLALSEVNKVRPVLHEAKHLRLSVADRHAGDPAAGT